MYKMDYDIINLFKTMKVLEEEKNKIDEISLEEKE
jgi:hypothetical protein